MTRKASFIRSMATLTMIIATASGISAAEELRCTDETDPVPPVAVPAYPANSFLNSLGVNLHIDQGYNARSYIEPLRYLGIRQARDGSRNSGAMISVARATGLRFTLIAGGDMDKYFAAARSLANTGVLLAIEGPNEPNNFPITYKGQKGGGSFGWSAVAEYQRDLYARAKGDPAFARFPVFAPSEVGAQTENVGLQFLTIPDGAPTVFPAGTQYADFANVHNYVSAVHGGYDDNQAWNAADPTLRGRWDGLSGNNGVTWHRKFPGYSDEDLIKLPRVTTETGYDAGPDLAEQRIQAVVLVNTYLAQFARGWAYTFIYELRDNEGGKSLQGLYNGDKPKLAADHIHNLTTLLADAPDSADAADIAPEVTLATSASTVHAIDLVKSDGERKLVVWGERVFGNDPVVLHFNQKKSIKIYDPGVGLEPVEVVQDKQTICLNLTDHALIIDYSNLGN